MSTFSEYMDTYLRVPPNSPTNNIHKSTPTNKIKKESSEPSQHITSLLCKRKYDIAFDKDTYEGERYGEHIEPNYFEKGNIGHGVYQELKIQTPQDAEFTPELIQKINETYEWCVEYLRSKGKA